MSDVPQQPPAGEAVDQTAQQHQQQHQQQQQQQQQEQPPQQQQQSSAAPADEERKTEAQLYEEMAPLQRQLLMDQQLELIKQQVQEDCPLVSDITDLTDLEKEFSNAPIYLKKIQILKQKYPNFRRVRRDGSCFYRAYLFGIFEQIATKGDAALHKRVMETITKSRDDLKGIGFDEFVIDDFLDVLKEKLELAAKEDTNMDNILSVFCDKATSDYLVMYLRLLTSGALKINRELYECFIDQALTIDQYCNLEVEPIDKEADQVPMMALINYLSVPINIVYLDQNVSENNFSQIQTLTLPEGTNPDQVFVTLLYRPGHYDVLYRG